MTDQFAPSEEFVLHCDAPKCEASVSMVAGIPRAEHGWGRITIYTGPELTDYDLCNRHWKRVQGALWDAEWTE